MERLLGMMIVMPLVKNTPDDAVHWDITLDEDYNAVYGENAPNDNFDILSVTLALGVICFSFGWSSCVIC